MVARFKCPTSALLFNTLTLDSLNSLSLFSLTNSSSCSFKKSTLELIIKQKIVRLVQILIKTYYRMEKRSRERGKIHGT